MPDIIQAGDISGEIMRHLPLFVTIVSIAGAAQAGEKPLYAPAPEWVLAAPAITPAQLEESAPAIVIFDAQSRFEKGVTVSHVDTATRVVSAQALGSLGNIAIPWMPDLGDLTVHRAEILRGSERIDLLAKPDAFTILRREEMMEQRTLTGMLTASMSVEGLRVGDVLRVSFSISQSDKALQGRVAGMAPTPATPARIGFGRARFLWPEGEKIRWKGYATGLAPVEKTANGMHELTVTLPLAKQPEMPEDLPQRLQKPLLIEATSFADWADVSRTLAPQYATKGLIAPGSALAKEVATIAAAETDPLKRTQRALDLVEEQVRYLAVFMNGGGLTPQAPAKTWELRYGDCKAKTLLLLAMLHELGVEAEPFVVSAQTGGLVEARLPSVSAFDHIIVRATVGGETLWLDGTRLGDRIEDIRDTPPFGFGLPLRAEGAALMAIPGKPAARPTRTVDVRFDQSAGLSFPSVFDATMTLRGGFATVLDGVVRQANEEQKRQFVQAAIAAELGEAQLSKTSISYDAKTGTATVTASGMITTPWRREEGRYRLSVDRAGAAIGFAPDRTRAAWRALPVATPPADGVLYRTTIKLPYGISGYALEGDQTFPDRLAGRAVKRKVSLAGGVFTLEDRVDSFGAEIAAADLPAERARYQQAKNGSLRLLAPSVVPSRYDVVVAARKDGRFKPIEAVFAAAIAADPDEITGYSSRASFRAGIYDRAGAIADLSKMIELGDDAETRIRRGEQYEAGGDYAKAIADYEEARALDPASDAALNALAEAKDRAGDGKAALALLDERAAVGDKAGEWTVQSKAEILALNGQAAEGVALIDPLLADRPNDSGLLNARCWNRGIGNIELEAGLKDCTKAIEIGGQNASALDSRALIYARMGRWTEALADLDAALEASPGLAASFYVRSIVRAKLGKPGAQDDLARARMYDPQIEARYKRMGVTA